MNRWIERPDHSGNVQSAVDIYIKEADILPSSRFSPEATGNLATGSFDQGCQTGVMGPSGSARCGSQRKWRVELGNGSVNTLRPSGSLQEDCLWEKWNWRS
jgi:hypothetical protein